MAIDLPLQIKSCKNELTGRGGSANNDFSLLNHYAAKPDEVAPGFDLDKTAFSETGIEFTVTVQASQQRPFGVTDEIAERHKHFSITLQATVDQRNLGIIMLCYRNDDTAEVQVRAAVGMKTSQCCPANTVGFPGITDHQDLAILLQ
ncbi:hypothetical protein D3C85_1085040 [compost metagenome]